MRLELGKPVNCTDGPFGKLADVIIDPTKRAVTHLVVEPDGDGKARLVPIELASAEEGETPAIALRCSVEEAGRLDPVEETAYIRLGESRYVDGRKHIEFSLLEHLCRRPTEVASRADLLESVWGPNWVGDTHVVDVHLSNLRRKLDSVAPDLRIVHTVRGVGFRISNELLDAAEAHASSGIPAPGAQRTTANRSSSRSPPENQLVTRTSPGSTSVAARRRRGGLLRLR